MSYEERKWIADDRAQEMLNEILQQQRIYYCFAFHRGKAGRFPPFTFTVAVGEQAERIRQKFKNPIKVERTKDKPTIIVATRSRKNDDYYPEEIALLRLEEV